MRASLAFYAVAFARQLNVEAPRVEPEQRRQQSHVIDVGAVRGIVISAGHVWIPMCAGFCSFVSSVSLVLRRANYSSTGSKGDYRLGKVPWRSPCFVRPTNRVYFVGWAETRGQLSSIRGGAMNRRDFVRSAGIISATLAFPVRDRWFAEGEGEASGNWRTFEVTTRVEVLKPSGTTRIWVPAALVSETPFQKTLSNSFNAEGGTAKIVERKADALGIIAAEFATGVKPILTVTSRIATKNCSVDLSVAGKASKENPADLQHFLQPTKLLPTDGIVKATATEITGNSRTDVEKARAIYEWIVDNTFRNPKTRGCGVGDIRFMLESRDLGGKCADLNALYVGLARAAGLPARDVYGIRVAKSELGYKSLGASSEKVTKAQHCRAEVYLSGYGWVPVDPADVRKVVLEEPPGNLPLDDEMVKKARARLFGSWEMNWMAYNFAHDVVLPGSGEAPIGFFMYPQAETAEGRLDCLDPDGFKYEITSRETVSATG
jgi:transglutaminase-like putative cysteine protease